MRYYNLIEFNGLFDSVIISNILIHTRSLKMIHQYNKKLYSVTLFLQLLILAFDILITYATRLKSKAHHLIPPGSYLSCGDKKKHTIQLYQKIMIDFYIK